MIDSLSSLRKPVRASFRSASCTNSFQPQSCARTLKLWSNSFITFFVVSLLSTVSEKCARRDHPLRQRRRVGNVEVDRELLHVVPAGEEEDAPVVLPALEDGAVQLRLLQLPEPLDHPRELACSAPSSLASPSAAGSRRPSTAAAENCARQRRAAKNCGGGQRERRHKTPRPAPRRQRRRQRRRRRRRRQDPSTATPSAIGAAGASGPQHAAGMMSGAPSPPAPGPTVISNLRPARREAAHAEGGQQWTPGGGAVPGGRRRRRRGTGAGRGVGGRRRPRRPAQGGAVGGAPASARSRSLSCGRG